MISESFSLTIVAILLIVLLWFLFEEVWDLSLFARRPTHKAVINLSTLRALSLFTHHDKLIAIDVRPRECYITRHLPGAVNAPFEGGKLDAGVLKELPRENPVLVYCDGGFRSRKALEEITSLGFEKVFHLNRGLLMWRLFGGPAGPGASKTSQSQLS